MAYYNNATLTAKKQRELEIIRLDKQIAEAEGAIRDLSSFFCTVSPRQTLAELESLRHKLRFGTPAFEAVKQLVFHVRHESLRQESLDKKAQWDHIAAVAEQVMAAALLRRDERLAAASQGTTPLRQPSRQTAKTELSDSPAVPHEERNASRSTMSAQLRRILSPPRDAPDAAVHSDNVKPVITPSEFADVHVDVTATPSTALSHTDPSSNPEILAPQQTDADDFEEVPTAHILGRRSSQHVSPPLMSLTAADVDRGATPLTVRAIVNQEIHVAQVVFDAKLEEARTQWKSERAELVAKFERLMQLLAEQHELQRAEETQQWEEKMSVVTADRDFVSAQNTILQQSVEKLTQSVQSLTQRLVETEQRHGELQDRQMQLHMRLAGAVTAAHVLPVTLGGSPRRHTFTSSAIVPTAACEAGVGSPTQLFPDPIAAPTALRPKSIPTHSRTPPRSPSVSSFEPQSKGAISPGSFQSVSPVECTSPVAPDDGENL